MLCLGSFYFKGRDNMGYNKGFEAGCEYVIGLIKKENKYEQD